MKGSEGEMMKCEMCGYVRAEYMLKYMFNGEEREVYACVRCGVHSLVYVVREGGIVRDIRKVSGYDM